MGMTRNKTWQQQLTASSDTRRIALELATFDFLDTVSPYPNRAVRPKLQASIVKNQPPRRFDDTVVVGWFFLQWEQAGKKRRRAVRGRRAKSRTRKTAVYQELTAGETVFGVLARRFWTATDKAGAVKIWISHRPLSLSTGTRCKPTLLDRFGPEFFALG